MLGRFWRLLGMLAPLPEPLVTTDDFAMVPPLIALLSVTSCTACTADTTTSTTKSAIKIVSFFIISSPTFLLSCQQPPTICGRLPMSFRLPASILFSKSLSLRTSGVSSRPFCNAAAPFSTMFRG